MAAAGGQTRTDAAPRLSAMIVERCWLCLEQPAVSTVELADGRTYPVCDVCAVEQQARTERDRRVGDDEWAAIVEHLQD